MSKKPEFDCIVISGLCTDASDVAGGEFRRNSMLTIDGYQGSLPFLREYFRCGRDPEKAAASVKATQEKLVTIAGPFLQQYLERSGFKVALVPHMEPAYFEDIRNLLERGTKYVIISTTFTYATELLAMVAGFVKSISPETIVISGGIFVYKSYRMKLLLDQGIYSKEDIDMFDQETQQLFANGKPLPVVDAFVINVRGETSLVNLLNAMERDKESASETWKSCKNVAYYDTPKEEWKFTEIFEEPYEPMVVDWSKVVPKDCRSFIPVQVAQGCPFQCMFCDFWGLHSKEFRHSIESVLQVISTIPLVDGHRRVFFTDDNLFNTKKMAKDMCQALMESGLNVRWQSFLRANSIDEEIADLMARSGCVKVLIGVESGSEEQQKRLGKFIGKKHLQNVLSALNKAGISTFLTLMCGFPGEDEKTVQETIEALNQAECSGDAIHEYCIFKFAALPLSKISRPEHRKKYNLKGAFLTWKHNTMNSDEAEKYMAEIARNVKADITPHYTDESYFLEEPYLSMKEKKKVTVLRNKIMKHRISNGYEKSSPEDSEEEKKLWNKLEEIFQRTTPDQQGNTSFGDQHTRAEKTNEQEKRARLSAKELQFVMADPSLALKIKKDPYAWKQVKKPLTLGKLMHAALDPSRLDKDKKLAELVEKLKVLTGVGAQ